MLYTELALYWSKDLSISKNSSIKCSYNIGLFLGNTVKLKWRGKKKIRNTQSYALYSICCNKIPFLRKYDINSCSLNHNHKMEMELSSFLSNFIIFCSVENLKFAPRHGGDSISRSLKTFKFLLNYGSLLAWWY